MKRVLFWRVRNQKLKETHLLALLFLSPCVKRVENLQRGFSRKSNLWIGKSCWHILFLILDHCCVNSYTLFCAYLERNSALLGICFRERKTFRADKPVAHFTLSKIFRNSCSFINNRSEKNRKLPRKFNAMWQYPNLFETYDFYYLNYIYDYSQYSGLQR